MVSSENQMRVGVSNKLHALPRFPILSTSRPGIAQVPQSQSTLTRVWLTGENATALTGPLWPASVCFNLSGCVAACAYAAVVKTAKTINTDSDSGKYRIAPFTLCDFMQAPAENRGSS